MDAPNHPKNQAMQTVCVRISPELRAEVAKLAEAMDRPESWIIRKAIQLFLDQERPSGPDSAPVDAPEICHA